MRQYLDHQQRAYSHEKNPISLQRHSSSLLLWGLVIYLPTPVETMLNSGSDLPVAPSPAVTELETCKCYNEMFA